MRFTNEDKRKITRAQGQYAYEYDLIGDSYFIGYRCRRCRRVLTRLSDLQVDRIKPRSKRGTDNPGNLQLLCPACNKKKGSTVKKEGRMTKAKRSTAKRTASTTRRKGSTVSRKRR
jgi:5-methylcytosine-specific restriction endonuclease McrA